MYDWKGDPRPPPLRFYVAVALVAGILAWGLLLAVRLFDLMS